MMHGGEKSDPAIVATKPPNDTGSPVEEGVEPRAGTEGNATEDRTRRALNRESVSQGLDRVRQAARQDRTERFTALLHHIDLDLLRTAFFAPKRGAAPGVDGVTWRDYEANLEPRLRDLHDRVQRGAYRAQPARRSFIPKSDGARRPLAISSVEDKIVQRAAVEVLNAIYEGDFLGFSYGFRPGRGPHDALDALCVGIVSTKVSYILDADIRSFFDMVSQDWLMRFLEHRIGDPRMLRPDPEMAQGGGRGGRGRERGRQGDGAGLGGVAAPRQRLPALRFRPLGRALAAARGRRQRGDRALRGRHRGGLRARSRRPALSGCHARAARRFLAVAASGQDPPDRVRPLCSAGPAAAGARQARHLHVLGFTFICGKSRQGRFQVRRKSRGDRMKATLKAVKDGLRRRMHQPIPLQGRWLKQVVTGYFNYHAVPTNSGALAAFRAHIVDLWRRTLRRRSQKDASTWKRIARIADDWLPKPRILHPWPHQRFVVKHPRWEPYAGIPHVRICAGGAP